MLHIYILLKAEKRRIIIIKKFDYGLFKLLRPLPHCVQRDKHDMPIIKKLELFDINGKKFNTLSHINNIVDKDKTIVLMFEYDKYLFRIWNKPHNYLANFSKFYAIATPDFSIYQEMDKQTVSYMVYMNRWLGCFYQCEGIKIIPTISWCGEDTYDVCFSGIEKGSIVAISTIGCLKNKKVFLSGFNEMIKRIEPSLIIVKGKFIEGMSGNIKIVPFNETFNIKKNGGDINGR